MNLGNIPYEIRGLEQWVCTKGDSKVPIDVNTNRSASSTDPETWSDYHHAFMKVFDGECNHVGFVFNNNGIVGIDIDAGYEDGLLSPLATDIIGRCKSYTEKSKSGRGFHILVKGDIPFKGKNNLNGVEIYKQARFFIMTGDVLLYNEIIENQEAIDYILNKYFPNTQKESGNTFENKIYNPTWEKPQDGKIKLRPVYPKIHDGCRNICLTSLAGMLHNQGYTPQQIFDELSYCNAVACTPMLPEQEVESIVCSVTRYKR